MTLLEIFRSGDMDGLFDNIGPDTSVEDITELYMNAEWTEDILSRVSILRIDTPDASKVDVPMIIGVSSKMGFLDIIRILVYRNGFEPEGVYHNFDLKYNLSALETAIVHGKIEVIDLLVQCGTTNKWGEDSNITLFEFSYMSRQLESMKRLVFWSPKLSTGICNGDSWVRSNMRMVLGMDRCDLRVFSESADSDIERETEKVIRLYMLNFLENDIFKK